MSTSVLAGQRDGPFGGIAKWWRNRKHRDASARELDWHRGGEVAHLAHELGVDASELRTLAGRWPDSADLLLRRMDDSGSKRGDDR